MRRLLVGGVVAFALTVAPASAAKVSCKHLSEALANATADEVITLKDPELCKGPFPYKLPTVPITLKGVPGAGFTGGKTVQLEGTSASATIEGLIFENANNAGSGGGAVSVNVAGSPAAFTLSRDSFINDVAAGGEGGGARINTATGAVTVTESTFTGDSAQGNGGGLVIFATNANLSGDTFSSNSAGLDGRGGGLMLTADTVTLLSSQFDHNTATDGGGGADISTQSGGGVGATLSGDSFTHNSVADPQAASSDPEGYLGGGLVLHGVGGEPTSALQSADTFDSNSVSFKVAPRSAMGAGEAVTRVALQSAGDRFTNNTLQPPDEATDEKADPVFGWGAGLSVVQCADTIVEPPAAPLVVSRLVNAVVAGNTLISGPSANGAGIYVGFPCATAYTSLELLDSTVAGNVVLGQSGPIAGISGGPNDVLSLANTIVSDNGGAELGGFGGLAGVSAAFSDVCSGGSALPGVGDICAAPALVGAGPGSADVHETAVSPTIQAGSNALVPIGLTSDTFGGARIVGPLGCDAAPAPIVDIGAAEYAAYAPPVCTVPRPHISLILTPFVLSGLRQTAKAWREGRLLAHVSSTANRPKKKPPVGTTFYFSVNKTGVAKFTFTRSVGGRRVGKRCVAQTKSNAHARRCARTITAGTLSVHAHTGTNKVSFQGRLSTHKKLAAGHSYKVSVTAIATVTGRQSGTSALRFTIAR